MPFRYRLQKVLDVREREKKEQEQQVLAAKEEVLKIENLIELNRREIATTKVNMRKANFTMYEAYDVFLKHLYEKEVELLEEKEKAEEVLRQEKEKLIEAEKKVKVLEKHKEHSKELYIEEEKKAELKALSETAVQKHFAKTRQNAEDAELDAIREQRKGRA